MTDSDPGFVIDDRARQVFLYGACAGLAIAMHRRTGWTLLKVTDAQNVYPAGQFDDVLDADLSARASTRNAVGAGSGGLHWGVLHPGTGLFVDVRGLHTPADIVEEYDAAADDGQAAIGRTTIDDALDEYVTAKGEPVPIAEADKYVDPLLALIARQSD